MMSPENEMQTSCQEDLQFARSFVVSSSIFNHLQAINVSDWKQTNWLHPFNPQWGSTLQCIAHFCCCNLVPQFSIVVQAGLGSSWDFNRRDLVISSLARPHHHFFCCVNGSRWNKTFDKTTSFVCDIGIHFDFLSFIVVGKTFATQKRSWR